MPRLLTSLLVLLLGAWPARPSAHGAALRNKRGRRRPSRLGDTDTQDPVEAPARARAQTLGVHHWPGETIFSAGDRHSVVRGRWRLTLDPAHRTQAAGAAGRLTLDPGHTEAWQTELEALLTLQVSGARLRVACADTHGWQLLEVRAPTNPETVVLLDRAAVARVFDCESDRLQVAFRILGQGSDSDYRHSPMPEAEPR